MSNVLIGIIGVILFIGLALAGALLLGDDFKSANNDTKAASIVQGLVQTASAVSMSNIKTGAPRTAETLTTSTTLIPRFLKAAPVNPITDTVNMQLVDAAGATSGSNPATGAVTLLGTLTNAEAKAVCDSIQRQSGQIAATDLFQTTNRTLVPSSWTTNYGCFQHASAGFYAYHKI
jgi:hypothetical protein